MRSAGAISGGLQMPTSGCATSSLVNVATQHADLISFNTKKKLRATSRRALLFCRTCLRVLRVHEGLWFCLGSRTLFLVSVFLVTSERSRPFSETCANPILNWLTANPVMFPILYTVI